MDKRTFKCFECNHTWEVEYGIKRPSECPNCGSVNLHRENGKGKRSYRWRGRGKTGSHKTAQHNS